VKQEATEAALFERRLRHFRDVRLVAVPSSFTTQFIVELSRHPRAFQMARFGESERPKKEARRGPISP
jgi:hypothetical protein